MVYYREGKGRGGRGWERKLISRWGRRETYRRGGFLSGTQNKNACGFGRKREESRKTDVARQKKYIYMHLSMTDYNIYYSVYFYYYYLTLKFLGITTYLLVLKTPHFYSNLIICTIYHTVQNNDYINIDNSEYLYKNQPAGDEDTEAFKSPPFAQPRHSPLTLRRNI